MSCNQLQPYRSGELMSFNVAKGQGITLIASFVDAEGEPYDPSGVVFQYREPSGLEGSFSFPSDAEVVRTEIGKFSINFVIGVVGKWTFKTVSTGVPAAASEDQHVYCSATQF